MATDNNMCKEHPINDKTWQLMCVVATLTSEGTTKMCCIANVLIVFTMVTVPDGNTRVQTRCNNAHQKCLDN